MYWSKRRLNARLLCHSRLCCPFQCLACWSNNCKLSVAAGTASISCFPFNFTVANCISHHQIWPLLGMDQSWHTTSLIMPTNPGPCEFSNIRRYEFLVKKRVLSEIGRNVFRNWRSTWGKGKGKTPGFQSQAPQQIWRRARFHESSDPFTFAYMDIEAPLMFSGALGNAGPAESKRQSYESRAGDKLHVRLDKDSRAEDRRKPRTQSRENFHPCLLSVFTLRQLSDLVLWQCSRIGWNFYCTNQEWSWFFFHRKSRIFG